MSTTQTPASCHAGFEWMKNGDGQDSCTIAAWLIELCQDPSSDQPALLAPLQSSYLPPNGTSANTCTCSWAFYNSIQACAVCQDSSAQNYSSWSGSCDLQGLSSTSTYWRSTVTFSNRTELPRWSIIDPSRWTSGTFNATQAADIAGQTHVLSLLHTGTSLSSIAPSSHLFSTGREDLPDVTDTSASQPTLSPLASSGTGSPGGTKKTPVGAIAGGVVAGVLLVLIVGFALWYFVLRRRRLCGRTRRRRHVDLDADPGPGGMMHVGNPLAAHLHSQSLGAYSTSLTSYHPSMQQTAAQSPNGGRTANVITGVDRTSRESNAVPIPTVAEQLDEKRRIRAERQNSGGARPALAQENRGGTMTRSMTRTGSSTMLNGTSSEDDVDSVGNRHTRSHSQPQSQSQIAGTRGSGIRTSRRSSTDDADERGDKRRASRRLSLKNAPWNRRRAVMNRVGSDVSSVSDRGQDVTGGALSTPNLNVNASNANARLPLNGTVASAGQTTTASEVIAAVPGARLPTARDRENPPPGYSAPGA